MSNLDALADLLVASGDTHWLDWITTSRAEIATDPTGGLCHLLRAFGGMGSLNDLWLGSANYHTVAPRDAARMNKKLWNLRSAIYDDAVVLRDEPPDDDG